MRYVFDATPSKAAIYTVADGTPEDDAPFTSPSANLASVIFHTDFSYRRVVADVTYSFQFPARAAGATGEETFTIAAHGLSGPPKIMAAMQIDGVWRPVTTATPIPVDGTTPRVSIGANGTHLKLHEVWGTGASARAATTVPLRILTTERILGTALGGVVTGSEFDLTPSYFKAGAFDTRYSYLRKASGYTAFQLPLGETWKAGFSGTNWGFFYVFTGEPRTYSPAGTVYNDGSTTLTGTGTAFLTDVQAGDYLQLIADGPKYFPRVASVESNTSLTLTAGIYGGVAAGTAYKAWKWVLASWSGVGRVHDQDLSIPVISVEV